MNYLDIILLIPLLWGLYRGFSKGLIIEIASVAALFLAVWGGIKFWSIISEWFRNTMEWDWKYLPLLSFAVIFMAVLLTVFGVAKLVERLAKAASLGLLNRMVGALFGVLKFGLLLSALIFLAEAVNKNIPVITEETKNKSFLYTWVQKIAPAIIPGLKKNSILDIRYPD